MVNLPLDETIPQVSPPQKRVLQQLTEDVDSLIECAGVMVSTLEKGRALPTRIASFEALSFSEKTPPVPGLDIFLQGKPVYLDEADHAQNLSVQAVKAAENGHPTPILTSDKFHDLLCPFVSEEDADRLQEEWGIAQVVAVSFKIDDEVFGTLAAATFSPVSERDREILAAFSKQTAAIIRSQRYLAATEALDRVILALQERMTDETGVLQTLADAVVSEMGYGGALVATLEEGNALPVRAFSVDIAPEVLQMLESQVGVNVLGPGAVVYLDDEQYQENLSVRAVRGVNGRPEPYLLSDHLYDLLRPVAPKFVADAAQKILGIRKMIAVPFFIDDEIVGNLFVASRRTYFTSREIKLLIAFSRQAAVGIRNARLYRIAEEQRQIAQVFSRMAFSANASVHTLRNHVGAVRTHFHLLQKLTDASPEQQAAILSSLPMIKEKLEMITDILDHLHEPWQQTNEEPVSIADCVRRALRDVAPHSLEDVTWQNEMAFTTESGITIQLSLTPGLQIQTTQEMLAEAFRILVNNAAESILEREDGPATLRISSRTLPDGLVEIEVTDSGMGIRPHDQANIFVLGWSTKKGKGMGFGLFWVKDYVNGLGGNIDVESTWQAGATFTLKLPLEEGA